ncbi:MAG: hypothetical protein HY549_11895 [Elusimicrobia bacterium]|nr:hypothetical protein [Elusimicrobiota bacterium]
MKRDEIYTSLTTRNWGYEELFFGLVQAFSDQIPSYVMEVLQKMIGELKEGRPCPAPQLGVSTYMTAALISAAVVRVVRGQPVPTAPEPLFFDPSAIAPAAAGLGGVR